MQLRADGSGVTLTPGWRALAIVGGILAVGLALLVGMLLAARRRTEERRQLEVPQFSAREFQQFSDHQGWIAQQSVAPSPERSGWPPAGQPLAPPLQPSQPPPSQPPPSQPPPSQQPPLQPPPLRPPLPQPPRLQPPPPQSSAG